ncbi:trypsin-like peptidase domain-containing protein [Amylibacter sp.]|nr:trypsin-like peptidase domain-containing protein [Amylibacter sp.]
MKHISVFFSALIILILGISNAWALPNCPSSGDFHNCFGTYTWANGNKYIGEWQNNKRNGQGINTWADGEKYIGEWQNDKRNGQGNNTWANGEKHVGLYKNDLRHGQGTYTYANGDTYEGVYKNDDRDGQGTYTYANGRKEVGEFKNNALNGYAITYFANGSIDKEGIFKDDEFLYAQTKTLPNCPSSGYFHNCFGTYEWENGEKYVGEWQNNEMHGQGTYIFSSGNKYVGEYKDGQRNGQGTFTWTDGEKYVGEYKDGQRSGQGIYIFADGRKEVGEFKNGKLNGYAITYFANGTIDKEGIFKDNEFLYAQTKTLPNCPSSGYFHNCFGLFKYDNGDKYLGEWQNDKSHGQGTYTWADGDIYIGEYKNDLMDGRGTYTWSAGDKYVGEWQNDQRHGQGTYIYSTGNKYVGRYKKSKKHGQGTFTWANGDRYVGEYKDGMSNGQGTYTWGSGEWEGDKYVGKFKNDQMHGQGTYTHANGRKEVGEFKNGKLNGYAIKYFADGSIDQEGIFKDDEFIYAEESSPNILNKDNQDNEVINASSGSGFAVSPDGYVITNNHVIEGCQEVILHTKEKDIKTRVIAFDTQNDLALLKGDFQPKTVFALSNNRPELLQDIYVAGYPFGNAISSSIKVTKGIVSSLTGIGNNFSNIQIDAALQSGNSGGPIIDDNGNVIAVAVSKLDAKYMLENFGSIPENTNFGIKSSVVKSILDSNDVTRPDANQSEISKTKLGKMISSGTYYISCWMTQAQIELLKSKKVLFEGLN